MAMIGIPPKAKAGEIVEVKLLVQHPMESGYRADFQGKIFPRDILTDIHCIYQDKVVFRAELFPAISANPFLSFTFRATASGPVTLVWTDMQKNETRETRELVVE